ncbi:MAG: zinc ribbon domain-containing protein [Deltaproteobacteria bacterium]|nr:zinc ribbon domain-containing protein [Deltaproteobacteria bacterium]
MPIYEYKCMDCDNEFEYLVFGNDKDIMCPKCEKTNVERKMSACGFRSSGHFSPAGGSSGCSSCSGGTCGTCH